MIFWHSYWIDYQSKTNNDFLLLNSLYPQTDHSNSHEQSLRILSFGKSPN